MLTVATLELSGRLVGMNAQSARLYRLQPRGTTNKNSLIGGRDWSQRAAEMGEAAQ